MCKDGPIKITPVFLDGNLKTQNWLDGNFINTKDSQMSAKTTLFNHNRKENKSTIKKIKFKQQLSINTALQNVLGKKKTSS